MLILSSCESKHSFSDSEMTFLIHLEKIGPLIWMLIMSWTIASHSSALYLARKALDSLTASKNTTSSWLAES